MRFLNCSIKKLNELPKDDHVICFGVSKKIDTLIKTGITKWLNNVLYFVDNDISIKETEYFSKKIPVYSPEVLKKEKRDYTLIIMPGISTAVVQMIEQLQKMNIGNVKCYSVYMMEHFFREKFDNSAFSFDDRFLPNIIEKKIHCCWFSGEEKPREYVECIESWKRACPDYEIIEWNKSNYNVEKNNYIKQAYHKRAWAFVSDYARLDLVYNFGGIYLDMDVEVLKPLDRLLKHNAFFSFDGEWVDLGSGFGAKRNLPFIKELMSNYEEVEFLRDGEAYSSRKVITQPRLLDGTFRKIGYRHEPRTQIIDDMLFLSPDFVNVVSDPLHDKRYLRGNEYAVHWHHAGWYGEKHAEELRERISAEKELLLYKWQSEE